MRRGHENLRIWCGHSASEQLLGQPRAFVELRRPRVMPDVHFASGGEWKERARRNRREYSSGAWIALEYREGPSLVVGYEESMFARFRFNRDSTHAIDPSWHRQYCYRRERHRMPQPLG